VMVDVGQVASVVRPLAHTIEELATSSFTSQPHLRFLSRPLFLQTSQLHAALFPS